MIKRNQKLPQKHGLSFWQRMARDWQLWLLAAIPITFFILFRYLPMFGVVISFQNYKMGDSFIGLDTDLLKMLSALVVAIFLAVPNMKKKYFSKAHKRTKEAA